MVIMHRWSWWVLAMALGCAASPAPPSAASATAPTTSEAEASPDPTAAPPPEAEPTETAPEAPPASAPVEPADELRGAPATLGVVDMTGHPARWNGETIQLVASLRPIDTRCTRSVPSHCSHDWQVVDADGGKSPVVRLETGAVKVPPSCRGGTGLSACQPGEVDPARRYRILGRFEYDRGTMRFVAEAIELLPEAPP